MRDQQSESVCGIPSGEAVTPHHRSRAQGPAIETSPVSSGPIPFLPATQARKFRRDNGVHHPLSDAEIARAELMFGCGKNTMQIRGYLHEERVKRGERHHVYEWQVYNALARLRDRGRVPQ